MGAIFKYQRKKSIATNLGVYGTYPTAHPHPLWQCNSGGHQKQDRQEAPLPSNGNEIFLQLRPSENGKFWCAMPPWPWMPRRLPIETPHPCTSSEIQIYLPTHKRITIVLSKSTEAEWSERVCWEKTGGIQAWAPTSSAPQDQILTSSWNPHLWSSMWRCAKPLVTSTAHYLSHMYKTS